MSFAVDKKKVLENVMRENIIYAAVSILQKKGHAELTMAKVAKEAQIAKGTVYLYFKNKEELIEKIIFKLRKPLIDKFMTIRDEDILPLEKIEKIFYSMLKDVSEQISIVKVLYRVVELKEGLKFSLNKRMKIVNEIFAEILKEGIKKKIFKIDDIHYTAKMLYACFFYMLKERAEGYKDVLSPEQEVKSFMKILSNGGIIKNT